MRRYCTLIAIAASACGIESVESVPTGEIALITSVRDAPAWTVPYGEEVWSRGPGINVAGAIERVIHAIRREPSTGVPRVHGRGYAAAFDGTGLRFSAGADGQELHVRTARIAFGAEPVYDAHGVAWSLLGNTAQARLAPSIVEHYETRADGVELAWIIRERHTGDLTIDVAINGFATADVSDGGTQLVDNTGRVQARIGAATLVDANGQRWPIASESITGGMRWRVAAGLLTEATFPVVLDPLISPEIRVADPVLGMSQLLQNNPSIAASSNGYLIAWTDTRDYANELRAARISTDGALLDPAGIYLAPGGPSGGARVASNGTDYLVVWGGSRANGVRVSAAGIALDSSPIVISAPAGGVGFPGVASNGTDYLVAWTQPRGSENDDVYAGRVSADGTVQDPAGIAISVNQPATHREWLPAVASNGSTYLVAWGRDTWTNTHRDIYASRVAFDGSVLDADGFQVSNAALGQSWPVAASDGTDYFVAWEDYRSNTADLYGSRVTASGLVLDPLGIPISTAERTQTQPRLVWNGSTYLAVWEDDRDGEYTLYYDIYGARIASNGTVVDPNGIALATGTTLRAPSVATNGGNYLVTWQETGQGTSWDIYARRFSSALAPVESKPFPVALSPNAYAPAIASNGTTFLVAWEDARTFETTSIDIVGTRLSATGTVLDPAGITISNASGVQSAPAISSNGTDYVVAWQDGRSGSGASGNDVYASRVSAAGIVGDPGGFAICTQPAGQGQITIASDGTDYLLAWRDHRTSIWGDIYINRFTSTGSVLDGDGVLLAVGEQNYPEPSLASNGSSYLLAWTNANSIFARRLTTGGIPDTSSVVATYAIQGASPSVASNGTDYLVAWKRVTNGPLYATRISAAGTLSDAAPIQLTASLNAQPPIAASDGIDYLVAWQRDLESPTDDIYATRVSAAGVVWDAAGLAVSASTSQEANPALAYNAASGSYAVAYEARMLTHVRMIQFCGDGQVESTETCDDGATVNSDGCSAVCRIEPGYSCTGAPSTCADIDECATNNGGCSPNAICTNSIGSFTCACAAGFSGDGLTCVDVDECATNHGGCSSNAACNNSPGSHTCTCNAGFAGDGVSCLDINECTTNNGGCGGSCTNTPGSYACSCPSGFVLNADDHACDDVDECATNNGGCGGSCTNVAGSYACACPSGFVLNEDDRACDDINECAINHGGCDQICTNTSGAFHCECHPLYSLASDGVTCVAVDTCSDGGTDCTNNDNSGGCRTSNPSLSVVWLLSLGVLLLRAKRRCVS